MATITRNVTTRMSSESPEKPTVLSFDFTGCTEAIYQAYTMAALTVKRQSAWRGKNSKGIPTSEVVIVKDHAPGVRAPAQTLEQQVGSLSAEERAALFAKYAAEKPVLGQVGSVKK